MGYAQAGPVAVKGPSGENATYPWATSVRVDRKGTLHVYGHHRQHAVFLKGEWSHYVVSAPTDAEILGEDDE